MWRELKTTLAEGSMVVQTTRYVNFSKIFEWVLVDFSVLFWISIFHFSEYYLCFR